MSAVEGFARLEFLIETDALEQTLGDPALRIFDCTTNLIPDPKTTYQAVPARADFEKGHIPGAQFIDLQADLSDNQHRFRFMLPSAEQVISNIARAYMEMLFVASTRCLMMIWQVGPPLRPPSKTV